MCTAVLESLARVGVGCQLSITIRFEKCKYIGLPSWDGLLAADREGMQFLREMKAKETEFTGVSPYMTLLLGDTLKAANQRTRTDRRPEVAD